MSDNVIILGAGASVDAGIPLLGNFVNKMLEYGLKGRIGSSELSNDDKKIFEEAMKVRNELDAYHGRAAFDDRNIEDILSILSFNLMVGEKGERTKLDWMTRAIARTIELTTTVKFDNRKTREIQKDEGMGPYLDFWQSLFRHFSSSNDFPTIITFNYDLVLERSLFQLLINTYYKPYEDHRFPFDGLFLKYYYENLNKFSYRVKHITYEHWTDNGGIENLGGSTVEPCDEKELKRAANIELLKLHGSINFPNRNSQENIRPTIPTDPVENAYILPPLLNKWVLGEELSIWKVALERLRQAKNIIIVGYSLPRTDIYMQYFFKAGLGPNVNLNKITVFNPVLFRNDAECQSMEERYSGCFSPQLRERIIFRPTYPGFRLQTNQDGTFQHFIRAINDETFQLFF